MAKSRRSGKRSHKRSGAKYTKRIKSTTKGISFVVTVPPKAFSRKFSSRIGKTSYTVKAKKSNFSRRLRSGRKGFSYKLRA